MLIVAPHQDRLDSARHVRAMQAKFEDLWPGSERPWVAVNGVEMDGAIQARRPRIVYFHGRAEQAEESLHLLLEGDEEALAPETLADYWKDHSPPQILFLNLVDDNLLRPNWAIQALASRIPLVIVQHWPQSDIQTARACALAWFEELLTNDDPHADPVGMLHDEGLDTAVAWAGYGSWRTEITDRRRSSTRQPLARLLLDRNDQRGKALQAMSELTRNRDRRMSCLLAYGGPGNMAAIFGQQIFSYLDQQTIGDSSIELKPLTLELPGSKSFGMNLVDRQFRENLGLGPKDSLKRALAQQKLDLPGNPMTVLLLDWQGRGLKREALIAWLQYCAEPLAEACPDGMRLLGCLVLEGAEARHHRLDQLFDELALDARFHSASFRLQRLDPLHDVDESHLAEYLVSGNCHCPEDLRKRIPGLIIRETGGRFEDTADLIDQAEASLGWYGLWDQLVAKFGEPADRICVARFHL